MLPDCIWRAGQESADVAMGEQCRTTAGRAVGGRTSRVAWVSGSDTCARRAGTSVCVMASGDVGVRADLRLLLASELGKKDERAVDSGGGAGRAISGGTSKFRRHAGEQDSSPNRNICWRQQQLPIHFCTKLESALK